jgi:hypothetical protein
VLFFLAVDGQEKLVLVIVLVLVLEDILGCVPA